MAYVNVGAFVDGKRPATKKALREAMASDPSSVSFDTTSPFDGGRVIHPATEAFREILQVTGPDPFTSRKWYASVKIVSGKVRVT